MISKTYTKSVGVLILLLPPLLLAGCGSPTNDAGPGGAAKSGGGGKTKILFVTNSNSDWWNAVEKGMSDKGKELGVSVEMRRNNDDSSAGQIRLLEDALSLDVQGVAVSVYEANSPGIADLMKKLRAAGKHVIAIDSDIAPEVADSAREAYIGTNNREAGKIAGAAAKALRPQGGRTDVFVGTAAAANAIERREGFFEGAGATFTQGEVFEDGANPDRARQNVNNAIVKNKGTAKEPAALLGLWSYNAPAIASEAAKDPEYRKKSLIVTFDLDEAAVVNLEKREIDATVCQNPYQIGLDGVQLLNALITKDQKTIETMLPKGAKIHNTDVRVIVPDANSPVKGENVWDIEKMKSWLAEKGLKSS